MVISRTTCRRFEFSAGSSNKFWEIVVENAEVRVRFGRIGAHGQTNLKAFATAAQATQHADKVIRAKLGKGYTEVC